MISKQTVYLNAQRTLAVKEGDSRAQYLLVRAGHEVPDAEVDRYEGAAALVGKSAKADPAAETSAPAAAPASAPQPAAKPEAPKSKARAAKPRKRH
jgi:hypothetical protein